MVKNILAVLLACFMLSCEDRPATPQEMILGHWSPVPQENVKPWLRNYTGFEFKTDSVCDYKSGFLDWDRLMNDRITPIGEQVPYSLGTHTKYFLTKDSLKIYSLTDKNWETYKVEKLTTDTLVINKDTVPVIFVKQHYDTYKSPDFDTVIVSSSMCYGLCPAGSTMISSNGDIVFRGDNHTKVKGTYSGKITQQEFNQIALKFKQANYISLNNYYLQVCRIARL